MTDLQTQQQALQAAVIGDDDYPDAGPTAGLAIYQHAYRARLIAALRDNYTVLHRAMGDEDFDALALAFIEARPSRKPSIRWFGDDLADFMAAEYAEALPHPSLADFARMDWALRGAFDAAAEPLLRAEDLQAVSPQDWPDLVFRLQPHVQLQRLAWAIESAWRALRAEEDAEAEEPEPNDHFLLIWREDLETRWRSLRPLEAALLQGVSEGRSFAGICELAAELSDEGTAAAAVVQALQVWLGEGLLCTA